VNVKFTRTGERRYRVSVEGPGVVSSWMEPAPGFDTRLPHDMAHFVVENELGITGGVFGQLAAGGLANTFHPSDEQLRRKLHKRDNRIAAINRHDAILSEKFVSLARQAWNSDLSEAPTAEDVSTKDIRRVCQQFDVVSAVWSKLGIGESMTLAWRGNAGRTKRHLSRHK
jgi:hypothetical protein